MLRYAENTQIVAENGRSEVVLWNRTCVDAHLVDKKTGNFWATHKNRSNSLMRCALTSHRFARRLNLFPRKITTGGGFAVDRRKVLCHYRFSDHRKMTFRCPVRVQKLFQIHLIVSDLIYIIAKKLSCTHSAILKKFRVHRKLNVFENGDFCLISVR